MPEKIESPTNAKQLWLSTPVGQLLLVEKHGALTSLKYHAVKGKQSAQHGSLLLKQVQDALRAYFAGQQPFPFFPIAFTGTSFQNKVWQALRKIPYGETTTYGELANKLNTSARAVGNACRENPISIIVPCHRVVSQDGLGGYGGKTSGPKLDLKTWLLQHEGAI